MKLFRPSKELNIEEINNVVSLSKKILHLLYVVMIFATIFIATLIVREWGILKFLLSVLEVLAPFFIGFVLAWILNPLVKKLEEQNIPRTFGSILVYAGFILFVILFLVFLVPTIYQQLQVFITNLPGIINELEQFMDDLFLKMGSIQGIDFESVKQSIFTSLASYMEDFVTSAPQLIVSFASSFFSSVVTIVFGIVIGIYMLLDFDSIQGHLLNLLPEKNRFEASMLIANISSEVRKSVHGTLLVAGMVFVCDSLGFFAVGLQAPILFGLLCGITDLIPYVGPYIGGVVAVVVGFAQSPVVGMLTLIVAVVVQLVENNILQPIVMSKTMKLHPVTIIVGLLIFEHFFGIIGMILCTPCIALSKVVWKFFKEKYQWLSKDSYENAVEE
ncbi:MAG: AI-2E family transporter [Bacilli bacterium]|nr:AI-2E family transporter [Bacilli bacterium]MBR1817615.1 AI-2E family transporter [Bacilli bacterium]